jgi:hypothetical protein
MPLGPKPPHTGYAHADGGCGAGAAFTRGPGSARLGGLGNGPDRPFVDKKAARAPERRDQYGNDPQEPAGSAQSRALLI